ncbi:MAG: aspartate--tRNA(Asn) ligase [Bacillota bacterium]|nr:aspartate--tRNA(Asn) ligase [Bacillota bacterium]
MKRNLIIELKEKIGKEVFISGWVHKIRKLSKVIFLVLRDRSGLVQLVIDPKLYDLKGLKLESVISVKGLVKSSDNKISNVELQVLELKVISYALEDLPISINGEEAEGNIDTRLNNRVISLRNPKTNAVFKVQSVLVQGFIEFLKNEEFTQVFTPKIVAEGAEGGTALFKVKYFEKMAYLAQSPQFYKQMLVGAGFERVFEVGQVYRAEEHNTLRHLNEYVSLDLEMGFIEDERDIMEMERKLLIYMFSKVNEECKRELQLLEAHIPVVGDKIPSMKLSDAIRILKEKYGKNELSEDLDPEGERLIGDYAGKFLNSDLLFLTHYPRSKRPMYTMPLGENLTHSFDLLYKGLEITTGGQRIHDYQMLIDNMICKGLNADNYKGYLDTFKFGMMPHGGLAIGLERLTAQLLGFKNVRETTLFPRDRERMTP